MYGDLKIFSGRAHPELGQKICDFLNMSCGKVELYNFADGEIFCQIKENVRGCDVFVIQPGTHPVNENLMELLIMLDACRRSSAFRITAVLPYYPYARQDKKDMPRVAISSKLVANLITGAGADRVLTMDLHAGQIQGYFDLPVDHLFAAPVVLEAIREMNIPDLTIVSPDAGGVERARAIASACQRDWRSPTRGERLRTRRTFSTSSVTSKVETYSFSMTLLTRRARCFGTYWHSRKRAQNGSWLPAYIPSFQIPQLIA